MHRRPLIAGNWKMNGLRADLEEIDRMNEALRAGGGEVETLICPPATLIGAAAARAVSGPLRIGGQDCHPLQSGPHTGDISAQMLADLGARSVILGHSERRLDAHETDALVCAKAQAALKAGLAPLICVGETLEERERGEAGAVVVRQVLNSVPAEATACVVLAYEPVWAIGTGRTPTLAEIAEIHAIARRALAERLSPQAAEGIRILYGGSVKPANAAEVFSVQGVDGALVGGASLRARDFCAIVAAHPSFAQGSVP